MNQDQLIGVILAAGKGSRMYPFSERLPKSLLPILNQPLLAFQLDHLARLGIKKVIIVIGHYGFEIVRAIGDGSQWGIEIEYVDQQRTLGIAHALGQLEDRIDRPFLLFLGDIYFITDDLQRLVAPVVRGEAACVLAARRETSSLAVQRNFAIYQGDDGAVNRVVEKPRFSSTDLKGCGLYAFDLHVFDAVRRTPRTAVRDEYEITDSIQLLIQDGLRVQVEDCIKEDLNLTFPEDLFIANQMEMERIGADRIIGENFSGPPPERITNSVIGDGVVMPASISVADSIILSGVRITEQQDLSRMIITPNQQVSIESGPRR